MDRLKEVLESLGFPIAYYEFEKEPESIPYIAYYLNETKNTYADNSVLIGTNTYFVELYTDIRDSEIEKKVENALNKNEIGWDKEINFDESEALYQITYTVNILGDD